MSTVDLSKIQKLVHQKRFTDVVFEIDSATSEKNRSALLHNILGVCRASQKVKLIETSNTLWMILKKLFIKIIWDKYL